MSRVVFVGLSADGHVNPALSIINALKLRGEEVICILSNKYKSLMKDIGCEQIEFKYSKLLFGSYHLNLKGRRNEEEFIDSVNQFYKSLDSQIALANKLKHLIISLRADYIIHDSTMFYIKYICNELSIPCISSVTLFALNEKMFAHSNSLLADFYSVNLKNSPEVVVNRIKEIEMDYYLKSGYKHSYLDNSMTKQELNIVYTSKAFQPYSHLLDATYHFAGNNLEFRKLLEKNRDYSLKGGQKVILISFGSTNISSSKELVDFYSSMMKYFYKYDAIFVLNIGSLCKSQFDSVPNNFILENGINQLQLLELADLFITHGGMNSVSESIQLDTPMIVMPQAMDQFMVAEQVEKNGLGKMIRDDSINFDKVENLISKMLANYSYSTNIKYIADSYRDTGEEWVAVEKILKYVGR